MKLRSLALFESILRSYTFIHHLVKRLFNDRLKIEKKNKLDLPLHAAIRSDDRYLFDIIFNT